MHDIFVSYSKADRDCAFALAARVEASGLSVWIAPRDVSPAADWAEEIVNAINRARIMVLVFSAGSNESPQVRREVERAVHRDLPILPFRIEDVLPARSLEYFLSSQHWLDAFPAPLEVHYDRLCATLAARLAGNGARTAHADGAPPPSGPVAHALAGHFAAPDLARLTHALATHVGPMAKILVRRAAAQATTLDQLKGALARELAHEDERQAFLSALHELG